MSTLKTAVVIVAVVTLTPIVVGVFITSLFGKDLVIFDRYKAASPKRYKALKAVCRVVGPIIAITCVFGLAGASQMARNSRGELLLSLTAIAHCAIFLWLSVRWFLWSLRT